jgi:hypothetical protein
LNLNRSVTDANDDGRKPEGASERSPKAGAGAPSGVDGNGPKRFSVQRKMAIVARLLRGEPLVSLIDCYVVQLSQVFMLRVFPVGTNY